MLAAGPHTLFEATLHLEGCPAGRAAGMKPEETGPCLVSSLGSSGPSLPALICALHSCGPAPVPSPALALTGLLSPLMPGLEGPSRKACGCPQSPGVRAPCTGRPHPRPPPASKSSFAWPWSCPRESRRSGSAGGSRRRKTYSGSCSSRSPSTEPPPSGGHPGCSPTHFCNLFIYKHSAARLRGPGALDGGSRP